MRTAAVGKPCSIAATVPASPPAETGPTGTTTRRSWRYLLYGLAVGRAIVAVIAIPLAPFLYREHVAVLVLLRPTKEVLVFAGWAVGRGDVALPVVVAAALPLYLPGVWVFYALGRAHAEQLCSGESLPGPLSRLLSRKRIAVVEAAVEERGGRLVAILRLATFPSTLVAAAAGATGMGRVPFLLADSLGALVALAVLLATGAAAGEAGDAAGNWLTAAGVALLLTAAIIGRRAVRQAGAGR